MRWCEENTTSFVKLYLDKECLWNPSHEWYKAKFRRETAYNEIIEEFKTLTGKCMTIPEVKTKIKNLRSTYTQQVQKILTKSNADTIYKPSLIWFHEMDRCLKYVPNVKTVVANFSQETHEVDSDEAAWPSQDKTLAGTSGEESSDPLNPLLYAENEYDTAATQESAAQVKIEHDSSPECSNLYIKRKKKKLKKPTQYLIRPQQSWYNEDEFAIYGKYIASQLRKMDLQSALKVQLEIQNLMKEAMVTTSDD